MCWFALFPVAFVAVSGIGATDNACAQAVATECRANPVRKCWSFPQTFDLDER